MNSTALLIGPDGDWVYEGDIEFLRMVGDLQPDYDATLFAIKNMGFVRVASHDIFVEIILHPRLVTEPTLATVQDLVFNSRATFFRIRFMQDGWRSETLTSSRSAATRLFTLCARRHLERPYARAVEAAMGRKSVLVAADDPTNMKLFTALVTAAGDHEVLAALDGAHAVELAREHLPNLIIMDLQLPELAGLEAARILKADRQTASIPIVAVTPQTRAGIEKNLQESGCDRYLAKPIQVGRFQAMLRAVLNSSMMI